VSRFSGWWSKCRGGNLHSKLETKKHRRSDSSTCAWCWCLELFLSRSKLQREQSRTQKVFRAISLFTQVVNSSGETERSTPEVDDNFNTSRSSPSHRQRIPPRERWTAFGRTLFKFNQIYLICQNPKAVSSRISSSRKQVWICCFVFVAQFAYISLVTPKITCYLNTPAIDCEDRKSFDPFHSAVNFQLSIVAISKNTHAPRNLNTTFRQWDLVFFLSVVCRFWRETFDGRKNKFAGECLLSRFSRQLLSSSGRVMSGKSSPETTNLFIMTSEPV
jgi:hypothetical protein